MDEIRVKYQGIGEVDALWHLLHMLSNGLRKTVRKYNSDEYEVSVSKRLNVYTVKCVPVDTKDG